MARVIHMPLRGGFATGADAVCSGSDAITGATGTTVATACGSGTGGFEGVCSIKELSGEKIYSSIWKFSFEKIDRTRRKRPPHCLGEQGQWGDPSRKKV